MEASSSGSNQNIKRILHTQKLCIQILMKTLIILVSAELNHQWSAKKIHHGVQYIQNIAFSIFNILSHELSEIQKDVIFCTPNKASISAAIKGIKILSDLILATIIQMQ